MSERDNETKRRIIKIAFKLFKNEGFDNVTINEICQESLISKHTFYYYFKTKDEVLASFRVIPNEIRAERLHMILTANSFFDQYWLLIEPTVHFFSEFGPEITKSFFYSRSKRDPKSFRKPEDKIKDEMELTLIKKAQESGEIRNQSDYFELLHLGFRIIFSTALFWSISGGERDLANDVRSIMEISFDIKPELRRAFVKCSPPPRN